MDVNSYDCLFFRNGMNLEFRDEELLAIARNKGPTFYLDQLLSHPNNLPFELREIESSLCEFDKYMRMAYPLEGDYEPGANPKASKRKFKGR